MKVYEAVFNEDTSKAVYALSVVENPAMQDLWITLSEHPKEVNLTLANEEKRLLLGAALIPDKRIYRNVDGNLNEILKEVEKLTFEHTIKADAISSRPFDNLQKKIFAKLYNVDGNVATNIQFSATDSLNHVLSGALYFYVKPNYDSIVPAIKYIENDMMHLIETLEWN